MKTENCLFRGLIGNETFVEGGILEDHGRFFIVSLNNELSVILTEVIPASVSQTTGKQDKNGKTIFVHDILCRKTAVYKDGQTIEEKTFYCVCFNGSSIFIRNAKDKSDTGYIWHGSDMEIVGYSDSERYIVEPEIVKEMIGI